MGHSSQCRPPALFPQGGVPKGRGWRCDSKTRVLGASRSRRARPFANSRDRAHPVAAPSSARGPSLADIDSISGVAQRYASALFELAQSEGAIDAVEGDLASFEETLKSSDDLKRLVRSPVFSADEQFQAISAIVDKAGMTGIAGNFIKVVGRNRRLFAIPDMIRGYRRLVADHRGETSAEVTVAHELSAAQREELAQTIKGVVGKDVALDVTVDESLLGGMIVKVGSRQIDTSLRTRLNNMKLALKAG